MFRMIITITIITMMMTMMMMITMIMMMTMMIRETQPLRRLSTCSFKRVSVERFLRFLSHQNNDHCHQYCHCHHNNEIHHEIAGRQALLLTGVPLG